MTEIGEKEVEIAAKAYADATGYYVEFHRGLSSPSAGQIRKGIRAALEAAAHARAEASDQYKNVEPGESWNAAYSSHARARWREETIQILAELQHGFRDSDIEAIADRIHAASQKGATSDE